MKKGIEVKGKLLVELGSAIILLFIITIIVNGYAVYHVSSKRYQARQLEKVEAWIDENSQDFFSNFRFDDSEYLITYWREHYQEMNLKDGYTDELDAEVEEVLEMFHRDYVGTALTGEEFSSLSPAQKLAYATDRYLLFNSLFNTYIIGKELEIKNIIVRVFIFDNEKNAFILFSSGPEDADPGNGSADSDSGGYALGEEIHFDLDEHPMAKQTLETREKQKKFEQAFSELDNAEMLNYYAPLVLDGKAVGLVAFSINWTEYQKRIWKNVADIEVINLIVLLAVAVVLLILVYILAIRPLRFVQDSLREYMVNKDSNEITDKMKRIRLKNEIGLLAGDMSSLAIEIDRYTGEVSRLSSERQRRDTELSIARSIQKQNLPKQSFMTDQNRCFELDSLMKPAMEVGGDFYDYYYIDDDNLALLIADVAGKGVPAALFMMMAKTHLKNVALTEGSGNPAEILKTVNERLYDGNDSAMFVTVWMGILTLSTGRLVTANGGHENPAIYREGKGFELFKDEHGLAIGIMDMVDYSEKEIYLNKNDMIFVYTDGITEAMNREEEQFGEKRMMDALNRNKGKNPTELLNGMLEAVREHTGDFEQSDDMTMLALRWLGND